MSMLLRLLKIFCLKRNHKVRYQLVDIVYYQVSTGTNKLERQTAGTTGRGTRCSSAARHSAPTLVTGCTATGWRWSGGTPSRVGSSFATASASSSNFGGKHCERKNVIMTKGTLVEQHPRPITRLPYAATLQVSRSCHEWFNRTYWFGGNCDWFCCRWCWLFMLSPLPLNAMFTFPSLESPWNVDTTLWKLSVGEAISAARIEGFRTSWMIEMCPGCWVWIMIGFWPLWLLEYVTALYGCSTVCDWFGGISTDGVLPPPDQRFLK